MVDFRNFVSLVLAWASVAVSVYGAEPDGTAPKATLVAPGVWRMRFGEPETFTPTHFRSAAMDVAGLAAKPFGGVPWTCRIPFASRTAAVPCCCRWTGRRASMGLASIPKLFDMTQAKGGQSGRLFSSSPPICRKTIWANRTRPCPSTFPQRATACSWTRRGLLHFTPEMFRRRAMPGNPTPADANQHDRTLSRPAPSREDDAGGRSDGKRIGRLCVRRAGHAGRGRAL